MARIDHGHAKAGRDPQATIAPTNAADAAISLPDGLEAAARSIDGGRARDTLDAWVESSRRAAAGA